MMELLHAAHDSEKSDAMSLFGSASTIGVCSFIVYRMTVNMKVFNYLHTNCVMRVKARFDTKLSSAYKLRLTISLFHF